MSLLVSAHDERAHIEPLLYQAALQHLLDLMFVMLCEEGDDRLEQLNANVKRAQRILEPEGRHVPDGARTGRFAERCGAGHRAHRVFNPRWPRTWPAWRSPSATCG